MNLAETEMVTVVHRCGHENRYAIWRHEGQTLEGFRAGMEPRLCVTCQSRQRGTLSRLPWLRRASRDE